MAWSLVAGLVFIGTLCVTSGSTYPELFLLMTERHTYYYPGLIYSVSLHHKNYTDIDVSGVVTPAAIDYDQLHGRMYWTDISTEEVRSANLDGSNDTVVVYLNNMSYPEGLTLDGGAGQVFYTDRGNQEIVKVDMDTFDTTAIVNASLDAPWGIVADTQNKVLYWVDHGHDTGGDRLESCDYEGQQRRTVTNSSIYAATGIALNLKRQLLYWCEYNGEVKSIQTDGSNQQELVPRRNPVRRFMDIAYFNGMLYITDYTNSLVYVLPENGGDPASLASSYFGNLNGIHVFSPLQITECEDGYYGAGCTEVCGRCRVGIICEKTVGVCLGGCDAGFQGPMCKEICDAGSYGYKCSSSCGQCSTDTTCHHVTGVCPSGCQDGWEGNSCKDQANLPQLYILLTERHESSARLGRVYKLFIHHMYYNLLTSKNVITPVSIDYDAVNKRVYWTDISSEEVRSTDLHGDDDIVLASLNNISYPEGIAVDGNVGQVFYTDRGNQVIVKIDTASKNSTVIVNTNLTMPWGIVADKTNKKLYWVDHTGNTIESCDYSGENRRTVYSQGVAYATGIAINVKLNRLYWCEYDGEVKSIFTNGTGYRVLLNTTEPRRLFMDISLFNGFLYMTDRRHKNITVIPEGGGTEMRLSSDSFGSLNGIHVFSTTTEETGCEDGRYGTGCTGVCGHCNRDTPCEKTVGVCLAGCAAGYKGEMCDDICREGTYGKDCEDSCGKCAEGTTCDHVTGVCPAGCTGGWKGNDCKTEACRPGNYGKTLCVPCGQCRNGDACDTITGKCPNGCRLGWIDDNCHTPCPSFKYGEKCQKTCGQCARSVTCDRETGECHSGCALGYLGDDCQTKRVCNPGTYGLACLPCGHCKDGEACDINSGNCPRGCDDLWMGYKCNIPKAKCHKGMYGPSCQSVCGHCKDGAICYYANGVCLTGCSPGWQGSICKNKCPHNKYGDGCQRDCGYCKDGKACDPESGTCPGDCAQGWKGDFCQTKIESTTVSTTSAANHFRVGIYRMFGLMLLLAVLCQAAL